MRRLTPLALAGAALIVACQDTQVPTTPDVLAPSMDVSDGAHQPSEGPFSNPDFFFLPPLVHDPSTNPDFEPAEFNPRAIPAVVFTDPEIAWAGVTETEAQKAGRRVDVAQFPWAASGRAQAVGRTEGLTKWLIDPTSGRVVGCGMVGSGSGDLVSEAVLAIEMGAAVRDVADTIHPHPTLSETVAAAAEVYLGTATDLYRPTDVSATGTTLRRSRPPAR